MIADFADPAVGETFAFTLGRLPEGDQAVIRQRLALATDRREKAAKFGGDVAAISSVSPSGVLWLDSDKLKRTAAKGGSGGWRYVESVIAHELSHLFLNHHRVSKADVGYVQGEYEADAQAVRWGYTSLVSFDTLYPQTQGGAPVEFGKVRF